jgi:hypothetical protein
MLGVLDRPHQFLTPSYLSKFLKVVKLKKKFLVKLKNNNSDPNEWLFKKKNVNILKLQKKIFFP